MKLIIDANVLFSCLISNGMSRRLLLELPCSFYSPAVLVEEFLEHIDEISDKTEVDSRLLKNKFKEVLRESNLRIVEDEEFEDYKEKALKVSPDKDDFHYFALALMLNCGIWSNDRRLKRQGKVRIYSTKDLIDEKGKGKL
jgi:predicted nucleic acid-binding protein